MSSRTKYNKSITEGVVEIYRYLNRKGAPVVVLDSLEGAWWQCEGCQTTGRQMDVDWDMFGNETWHPDNIATSREASRHATTCRRKATT
ncbi:hypothetical protein ACIQNU_04240 [Streptomyces sp. NPDC091292]|uniref:hypothetical protein n=1 Tax=Streptomyces sp. NPDC091292 TaxID=3365991 RepID=UPI00381AD6B9